MNTRACCIALIVGACVASPYGNGETNATDRHAAPLLQLVQAPAMGRVDDWGGVRDGSVELVPAVSPAESSIVTGSLPAEDIIVIASEHWSDPGSDFRLNLLEPALREARYGGRNPAGPLVLPAPQTSHAPAF